MVETVRSISGVPQASPPTAPPTAEPPLVPDCAWPVQIGREQAVQTVAGRLPPPGAADLQAELHLHPLLAVEFVGSTRPGARRPPLTGHALVDLIGGRAYVAEPWTEVEFLALDQLSAASPAPAAQIGREEAVRAARRVLGNVLLRRRRWGIGGGLTLGRDPVCVAKPNWWITGAAGGRAVEVLVDAVSGRHYAFRA